MGGRSKTCDGECVLGGWGLAGIENSDGEDLGGGKNGDGESVEGCENGNGVGGVKMVMVRA